MGRKIPIHEQGKPVRNWLHAADTANAITTIIESGDKAINQIYNICGGFEQENMKTITSIIQCYWEADVKPDQYVDFKYTRPGQDVRYAVDDSKLRSLGWKPEREFDKEIMGIVQFYKQNFIW